MKLFKSDIEPCCAYCARGTRISGTEVACLKRGIVSSAGQCGRFSYDPLKREPPVPAPIAADKYTREDFSID